MVLFCFALRWDIRIPRKTIFCNCTSGGVLRLGKSAPQPRKAWFANKRQNSSPENPKMTFLFPRIVLGVSEMCLFPCQWDCFATVRDIAEVAQVHTRDTKSCFEVGHIFFWGGQLGHWKSITKMYMELGGSYPVAQVERSLVCTFCSQCRGIIHKRLMNETCYKQCWLYWILAVVGRKSSEKLLKKCKSERKSWMWKYVLCWAGLVRACRVRFSATSWSSEGSNTCSDEITTWQDTSSCVGSAQTTSISRDLWFNQSYTYKS